MAVAADNRGIVPEVMSPFFVLLAYYSILAISAVVDGGKNFSKH